MTKSGKLHGLERAKTHPSFQFDLSEVVLCAVLSSWSYPTTKAWSICPSGACAWLPCWGRWLLPVVTAPVAWPPWVWWGLWALWGSEVSLGATSRAGSSTWWRSTPSWAAAGRKRNASHDSWCGKETHTHTHKCGWKGEAEGIVLWFPWQIWASAPLLSNTAVFPLTRLVERSQPISTNYNHQIVS